MKLDITGLHIEVTDAIRDFASKKVNKLDKFFNTDTICHVTYSPIKGKEKMDIRIEYKKKTYIAEEITNDLYYGIESLVKKIEAQVKKNKEIKEDRKKHPSAEVTEVSEEV